MEFNAQEKRELSTQQPANFKVIICCLEVYSYIFVSRGFYNICITVDSVRYASCVNAFVLIYDFQAIYLSIYGSSLTQSIKNKNVFT